MNQNETPRPPAWLGVVSWLPIVAYFVVKYAIIGREEITSRQSWLLIGAVILAEIALWQYRKQFRGRRPDQPQEEHGTERDE